MTEMMEVDMVAIILHYKNVSNEHIIHPKLRQCYMLIISQYKDEVRFYRKKP